jgi:hypothetical protein
MVVCQVDYYPEVKLYRVAPELPPHVQLKVRIQPKMDAKASRGAERHIMSRGGTGDTPARCSESGQLWTCHHPGLKIFLRVSLSSVTPM